MERLIAAHKHPQSVGTTLMVIGFALPAGGITATLGVFGGRNIEHRTPNWARIFALCVTVGGGLLLLVGLIAR